MSRYTMYHVRLILILVVMISLGCAPPSGQNIVDDTKVGPLAELVSIDFPKKRYQFSLVEVAQGVRFDYTITIAQDIKGVIPRPQDIGAASDAGPGGLMPLVTISGNGQSYSLRDIGLAPPHETPARTIKKKGVYSQVVEWDGRNWTGPSDFGNRKGDPFPPGYYKLEVRIVGDVVSPKGTNPYKIAEALRSG